MAQFYSGDFLSMKLIETGGLESMVLLDSIRTWNPDPECTRAPRCQLLA